MALDAVNADVAKLGVKIDVKSRSHIKPFFAPASHKKISIGYARKIFFQLPRCPWYKDFAKTCKIN